MGADFIARKLSEWRKVRRARQYRVAAQALFRDPGFNKMLSDFSKNSPEGNAGGKIALAVLAGIFILGLKRTRPGSNVPKTAEYLLYILLSKRDRENLLGDLAEDYVEVKAKFGRRAANFWYWKQVGTSTWPLIRKAARWGLLAALGEWIRRII